MGRGAVAVPWMPASCRVVEYRRAGVVAINDLAIDPRRCLTDRNRNLDNCLDNSSAVGREVILFGRVRRLVRQVWTMHQL
jgi:hypothetical protein